ncbi:MAG: Nif3-like dinuclear metal center hexameric protein [Clostridiales bacterium]|nr:Nif3-like dinuclear metal center hexameric protein [Clostridiales bacterium]
MFSLDKFFEVLDRLAPLSLSKRMIELGNYDNSGILIKTHSECKGVLFALDLSKEVVDRAVRLKCDTVVTHHPAIYNPLSSLSVEDASSRTVTYAVKKNLNVISMHLNLDVADGGIDDCLRVGLGGNKYKILEYVTELNGYGRLFDITPLKLCEFKSKIQDRFNTKKVVCYGGRNRVIKKVASFCGGGSSHADSAVRGGIDADVVVTSDVPHHVIKNVIDSGKCLVILPHYASEEYGFKKYFERVKEGVLGAVPTHYYDDKRFR